MSTGYYEPRIPWVLRALSCFECEPRCWRFRWGEISWRWGLCLELGSFEDGYSLIIQPVFGRWFIKLPRWLPHHEPDTMMAPWGFSWNWFDCDGSALHLNWGAHCKIIWMPWQWEHHRTEVLLTNGAWRNRNSASLGSEAYDTARDPLPDVFVECHPYHYLLPNGETQHVTATVTVTRTERRMRIFRWLPWPRRGSRYIDVWFSGEVGARAGSWKGGCLGCGYKMKSGEQPRDTLRRMQTERRFR